MSKTFIGPSLLTREVYTSTLEYENAGLAFNTVNTLGGSTTESWNTNSYLMYKPTPAVAQYHLIANVASPSMNKFLAGGAAGSTRLNIYSGIRPSIGGMTSLSNYSSNLLVSFSIPAYSDNLSATGYFYDLSTISNTSNISSTEPYTGGIIYLGVCQTFTAAVGTGKATWFWFGNYSSPTNLTGISFVTGDVGLIGSNSDLEMANCNIASGELYKSFGFKFGIPCEL